MTETISHTTGNCNRCDTPMTYLRGRWSHDNGDSRCSGGPLSITQHIAPDPTNCPQTPSGEGDPAEQAEPQLSKLDQAMASLEVALQGNALARLEAWQAEFPETRSYRIRRITTGRCLVELERHVPGQREVFVWGVDGPDVCGYKPGERIALAKEPGLAATIPAALDKASEVGL